VEASNTHSKMVFYGHKTVRAGERFAVWSMSGEVKLVDGPKRITLFRQKKQQLHCHTAGPESYLLIKKTDGSTEHVPGPCSRFPHPTEEVSIEVKPAVVISANEALVVSKQSTGNSKSGDNHGLEMRIVKGPARFTPAADEWVQQKLVENLADHNSYLEVKKRDGSIEVLPGPCSVFLDPLTDEAITTKPATKIDASEAIAAAVLQPNSAWSQKCVCVCVNCARGWNCAQLLAYGIRPMPCPMPCPSPAARRPPPAARVLPSAAELIGAQS